MNKIIILLASLFILSANIFASEKKADAVYLSVLKEYTLNADETWTYHHAHKLKLLSYYAFNRRYGETFIVFDTLYQNLKINHNVTTMVSGREVSAPDNAYNMVLPRYARDAEAYNHLREMVVTHVGIEPGAVIDLDYEIISDADFLPAMMGNEILVEDSPINELIVRIRIPDGKTLHHKLFNSDVQVSQKAENNKQVYEWKFNNLPAAHYEALQPESGDFLPRLVFSAADNWNQVKKQLIYDSAGNEIPQHILKDMLQKSAPPLEQVLAVQKKIVKEMAEFPVPLHAIGYRFRSAQKVWKSNGGTLLEKAVLMASILNSAGIRSRAVLVSGNTNFAEDVPCLNQYNNVLVCAKPDGGAKLFLSVHDLNSKSLGHKYAGHAVLALDDSGGKQHQLPALPENISSCRVKVNLEMDKDQNVSGQMSLALNGTANPYIELQRQGGDVKSFFKGYETENLRLREMSTGKLHAETSVKGKLNLKSQGDYLFYDIKPPAQGIHGLHIPTLSITRNNPLSLPYDNFREEFDFTIELADGINSVMGLTDIKKKNAVGEIIIHVKSEGQKIHLYRSLQFSKKDIPVAEYPQFLELWQIWNNPLYRELVFKAG